MMLEHNANITKPRAFSVSDLSFAIKHCLEKAFGAVSVKGEISGCKHHTSGHFYFALKDKDAVIDGICWRRVAQRLRILPEDGMEVVCIGRITTYPGRSKYQIVIETIELTGEGTLLKILEERKKKLLAEGLFSPKRKKPLPYLPEVIGVITSITGAVIHDILHRIDDRFPRHLLVWPVNVQGDSAVNEISSAIEGFNNLNPQGSIPRPDLLIVARGGGSLEDLWQFNDEKIVRAAADSEIPLISAVGHETDITLIDYAADYRAPTPTAAAERAVPVRRDLLNSLNNLYRRLLLLPQIIDAKAQAIDDRGERLHKTFISTLKQQDMFIKTKTARLRHPKEILSSASLLCHPLFKRLHQSIKYYFEIMDHKITSLGQMLESFSFQSTLKRGFSLVYDQQTNIITTKQNTYAGMLVSIELSDGKVSALISKKNTSSPKKKTL